MADKNKIVPFPAHKVRKSSQSEKSLETQVAQNGRRVTIVASLVFTIFVATLVNSRISTHDDVQKNSGRNIASAVNPNASDFNEDLQMAKKIARESLREPASRGREPTSEERLRFEAPLMGSYLIRMNEKSGALESIDYIESSASIRRLPDRPKFLRDNKDLIKIDFDTNQLTPVLSEDSPYKGEIYKLKERNTMRTAAEVYFKFDGDGNFRSMKVDRLK